MSVSPTSYAIEHHPSYDLAEPWDDISADVIGVVTFRHGIFSSNPLDRIAGVGEMKFALNNGPTNSHSTAGYYTSLVGANLYNLREIRFTITYDGVTMTKFYGYIPLDGIEIEAGQYGMQRVFITVKDYMHTLSVVDLLPALGLVPMQDKRIDEAAAEIIDLMPRAPKVENYDTGVLTFPVMFDSMDDKTRGLTELNKLVMSEWGFCYIRHSTTAYHWEELTIENRDARVGAALTAMPDPDSAGTFTLDMDNSMQSARVRSGKYNYNDITITYKPRRVDTAAVVLASMSEEFTIGPGVTMEFYIDYKDPQGIASEVVGTSMETMTATTDYTMFSATGGGGTDMTAYLTCDEYYWDPHRIFVKITNGSSLTGYINKFQARGIGYYTDPEIVYAKEDLTPTIGASTLAVTTPYLWDADYIEKMADTLKSRYDSDDIRLESVTYIPNRATRLMSSFVNLEIGDKIHVTEDVSRIDDDYFIQGIEAKIAPGGLIQATYYLEPDRIYSDEFADFVEEDLDIDQTEGIRMDTEYDTHFHYIGESSGAAYRGLLMFDLSGIPSDATIVDVKLSAYRTGISGATNNRSFRVYRVTSEWTEGEVTKTYRKTGVAWSSAGGDYNATALAEATLIYTPDTAGYVVWDFDTNGLAAFTGMIDGTYSNYGFLVKATTESEDRHVFDNYDDANPPILTVKYYTE